MIPDFDERGYLPEGVHLASLDEIEVRFGRQSEVRQVQMESLRWLVELVKNTGVRRLVINGSFVTDAAEPNDVDCVLLTDPGFSHDAFARNEMLRGIPFLEVHLVELPDFVFFTKTLYASDRVFVPKGMVEIVL
jgi:hypothetical protein